MKKISFILPAYNSEKTIQWTIDSIINQNGIDIELIIIDDSSTDSTFEICEKKKKEYKEKIILLKNDKKGVASARNKGLERASSELIMFVDADDQLICNSVNEIIEVTSKKEIEWIIFGYNRIMTTNNRIHENRPNSEIVSKNNFKALIEDYQSKSLFNQIWNKVYWKKIIDDNHLRFNEEFSIGEDYLFNIKYMSCINKIECINKIVYNYYSSPSGLNFKYIPNRLDIKISNLEELRKVYKNNNWDDNYINRQLIYTCLSGLANCMSIKDRTFRKEEINTFINNEKIHNELSIVYKEMHSVLEKIIILLLNCKCFIIIYPLAYFLKIIKTNYRKYKYE